ncbi:MULTISPECIES: glutathione S-transferase N-terminal domain-containing protein [unclassified Pseudoalteromonas]|uniref:glutathione S-transferase N-terminal domain-containing protein n=1 Tax=unclassified Pseudoalteromonas TaxID=194690 RepID=UPI00157213E5|nr:MULTISPECIES: glutathione S-transferase N-terminal domain-containing protein [unclassified Pseudoalteromonas]MBR8843854.1 glutathione S-transferase N-terminal domain-containing protein [Pseudoalteromonas sp. JC3]NSY34099.1 glutathione S-transferase [Pseudoalteromonas sp. JC28]QUI71956.1 glutathione S-transferase [Pseudoalteromonas sp. M8]WJE08147.1 glutathione S-transferase N-terminal domain-containing protein [Pseudoalteromonas sp. JC3]
MQLIVGTDSTWSLRAWICGQIANVDFDVNVIDLAKTDYCDSLGKVSDTGLVPLLIDEDLKVHDSLAIAEYFNELSEGTLYPKARTERAVARSLCSELHSGFVNLRNACPFTLVSVAPLQNIGDAFNRELGRVEEIFGSAKLPFMFESASAVDAFYSILAFRLKSYGITFNGKAGEYQASMLSWPVLEKAIQSAKVWKGA